MKKQREITDLFGRHLRRLRKEHRMSQSTLAVKAGCDISTLGRTERGEVAPTIKMVDKLCKALDVGLQDAFDFARERDDDEVAERLKDQIATLIREGDKKTLELCSLLLEDFIHYQRRESGRLLPPKARNH